MDETLTKDISGLKIIDNKLEDEVKTHPITIAYFSTPDCTVCKILRPKIEGLAAQYNQVTFTNIDV